MGLSKQLKQIIQIEHNIVKNPHWQEANQLAIYKSGWGFELNATVKQIQLVLRAGLKPGTTWLWVWLADHSATLPSLSMYSKDNKREELKMKSSWLLNIKTKWWKSCRPLRWICVDFLYQRLIDFWLTYQKLEELQEQLKFQIQFKDIPFNVFL